MQLTLTKQILTRLRSAGFYPDNVVSSYFAIMALHLGEADLLDTWDDYNKSRRAIVLYYDLVDKGLWEETPESPLHFKETEKGQMFAEELISLTFENANDVEAWIDDWLNLFPKGIKSGGKLLRSDRKAVIAKMKKFVKEFSFDKETILGATLGYLSERERDGWMYTKCATYLISKMGEGSELAALCTNYKESSNETIYHSDLI